MGSSLTEPFDNLRVWAETQVRGRIVRAATAMRDTNARRS
jgi:hypothetical protein